MDDLERIINEGLDDNFLPLAEQLTKQEALELESMEWGKREYREKMMKIKSGKAIVTNMTPGIKVLQEATIRVGEAIDRLIANPHLIRTSHNVQFLREILEEYETLRPVDIAFIGCREMMNYIAINPTKTITWAQIGSSIYKALMSHLNFLLLRDRMPAYVDAVLKAKKVTKDQYRNARVFDKLAKHIGIDEGADRCKGFALGFGAVMADLILEYGGFCERKIICVKGRTRSTIKLVFLPEVEEKMAEVHKYLMDNCPKLMPMIIKPRKRTSLKSGGYLTDFCGRGKLISNLREKDQKEFYRSNTEFPQVFSAVNHLQDVPFRINQRILNVMKTIWESGADRGNLPKSGPVEIPSSPYTNEEWKALREAKAPEFKNRLRFLNSLYNEHARVKGKVTAVSNSIVMANKLRNEPNLYFPFKLDFRGRFNTMPTFLDTQSFESSKALLEFSRAETITEDSFKWLLIHAANCFGMDKVSNSERVKWGYEYLECMKIAAKDPLGFAFWETADDPFKFLAVCFEINDYVTNGEGVTRQPVAQDGTCNGLQHFSMMLRDYEGGKATNLVPQDKPGDIYTKVLDELVGQLKREKRTIINKAGEHIDLSEISKDWLGGRLDRDLVKRPVMTMPYAVTQQGIRNQFIAHMIKDRSKYRPEDINMTHYDYLTKEITISIGKVVKSSVVARDFLKAVARRNASHGLPLSWTAPSGYKVYMRYPKFISKRIKTSSETHKIKIRYLEDTEKIDRAKQCQAISPNFVHSLDAAHLTLTVNECARRGVRDLVTVHDSYACHAGKVDEMNKVLREQFVKMYTETNPLEEFAKDNHLEVEGEKPLKVPGYGKLYPYGVLDSEYTFS